MASFLDQRYQFAPYVETTPVDAMVKVGMYKQQQYDAGVQKINDWIDQTAALPVMRPVDKQYLQSSLNNLTSELKKVAGADFSNQQLVQSVGGATKRLVQDPNIVAALYSTKNHQDNLQLMEEARQKGELTPDNEYNYTKALDAYYNSNELGQKFSAKYVPWFDVAKYTRETFNAIKPDGFTYDQVFETDSKGNPILDANGKPIYAPTMKRLEKEGYFPKTVKVALDQILSDPRVTRQLSITGQYNYRNYTPKDLQAVIENTRDKTISSYEEQLSKLALRKTLGENVQEEFDALDSQLQKAQYSFEEYRQQALTNPTAVASSLYQQQFRSNYTDLYGRVVTKETTLTNPGADFVFKLEQEKNRRLEFAMRLAFDREKAANDIKWKLAEYEQRERLNGTKKKTTEPLDPTQKATLGNVSAAIDLISTVDKDFTNAAANYGNASNTFLWESYLQNVPGNQATFDKLVTAGNSKEQAIDLMLKNTAARNKESVESLKARWIDKAITAYNNLTPEQLSKNPALGSSLANYQSARRIFDNNLVIKEQIEKETRERVGNVLSKDMALGNGKNEEIEYEGQKYLLTPQDAYDIAVYKRGHRSVLGFLEGDEAKKAAKAAASRLEARGKLGLADAFVKQGSAEYPISTVVRNYIPSLINAATGGSGTSFMLPTVKSSEVDRVYKLLNDSDYEEGLKAKAEIIQKHYKYLPNLNITLLGGEEKENKMVLNYLKGLGGAYASSSVGNVSPDFDEFYNALSDKENLGLQALVGKDKDGKPAVEIVAYGDKGARIGGMTLQPDEAANPALNLDLSTMYPSPEVVSLDNLLSTRPSGKSCAQDITDVQTYKSGDAYFTKSSFPGMVNSNYNVSGNVMLKMDGKYYPYVYVKNNQGKEGVFLLEGSNSLEATVKTMKDMMVPSFAEALLTNK